MLQNVQLLSSLESSKAELEAEREVAEQRDRKAKEVGQVVAELTEEVGRLRQQLAAAQAEASTLADERADLVAR